MTIELIVNVFMLLFGIYSFFYVGATMPKSSDLELGAEQWPQMILFLMFIALAYNIYRIIKANKKNGVAFNFTQLGKDAVLFFKSKLFLAMVVVLATSLLLEPLGFMVTCFLFLMGYGWLLGQRKIVVLVCVALLITIILYIGFAVLLGVMLPRGTVPFLRNFSLFVESIVPTF